MLDREILRNQLISRRVFLLAASKTALLSILLGRILHLQLFKNDEYKKLSDKNRLSLVMILPNRGIITDRKAVILADNRPCFSVKLDRRQSKDFSSSLAKLVELLELDIAKEEQLKTKIKRTTRKLPVTLIEDLNWQQLALIEENLFELPGLFIEDYTVRSYRFPESCPHIIGYVGKISEQEQQLREGPIISDFQIGKTGIEKQYENSLQGKFGYRQMEVDAHGLYVNELERIESQVGEKLELNIDINLQEAIVKMLPNKGGSAIVTEVDTGKVLALASTPFFNPNEFIGGISNTYWKQLTNDPYKPLINKTIQNLYPPGSAFKLITVLAALEAGIKPDHIFHCSGLVALGTKHFHCWLKHGHGSLNMIEAIKHSCNCYMFNIARVIGGQAIIDMANKFGFGMPAGIDLPGEQKGLVPDRKWKLRHFKYDWSLGDSYNIAIGQGALLTTPLQLAQMVSAIATGKIYKPRLVGAEETAKVIDIKQSYLDIVRKGMFEVMNSPGGTAYAGRPLNVAIAGKTGTAQVQAKKHANDDLSRSSVAWERRNHGLFVGFAPFATPKYAMSIVIDHGGSGSGAAVPIARQICELLF